MKCSIMFLCCFSLLEAVTPVYKASLSISLNGKLIGYTLHAKTVYQNVKDDNGLLGKVLELSQNPKTAVGVKRFVEIASEHAASVATGCSGLKSVLKEAENVNDWSSIEANVKQACDSREALSSAFNYWCKTEDFITTNIPSAVEYLDTSLRAEIEPCVLDLSTMPVCDKAS